MSSETAKSFMRIWQEALRACLRSLIGRKVNESAEEIAYAAWSEAIGKMYALLPGNDTWHLAKRKERVQAMEGKFFSLKNFYEEIFGPQMQFENNETEH